MKTIETHQTNDAIVVITAGKQKHVVIFTWLRDNFAKDCSLSNGIDRAENWVRLSHNFVLSDKIVLLNKNIKSIELYTVPVTITVSKTNYWIDLIFKNILDYKILSAVPTKPNDVPDDIWHRYVQNRTKENQ